MNRKQRRAETAQSTAQSPPPPPPAAARAFAEAIRDHQAGRLADAARLYRRALALHPGYAEAQANLGSALGDLGETDAAIACLEAALALRPDYPIALLNLGNALWAKGRAADAARLYRRAIDLRPDFAEAHNSLAIVLAESGALDDAFVACRRALALQPGYAEAHNTLGNVLRTAGRTAEALPCYRRAIALAPGYPDGHFNLGMALLARGELAEGWREYEWRWRTPQMIAAVRRLPSPLWQGEAAERRTLLLHAEQGHGDALQFCRYAPLAAALGFRVILEAPRPLVRLFRSLDGVDAVVARGEPLPAFDLHCPLMSLPLRLGTTLETIPGRGPYLAADPDLAAAWRARLDAAEGGAGVRDWTEGGRTEGGGLRVGLAWAGNPSLDRPARAAMDRRRSLAPERLRPLFAVPGIRFVSLQKDATARPGDPLPGDLPAFDAMHLVDDFADTAALIAQLDLVIAVDSAVAHLAGALGQPVWLLDRFDPCWRWLEDRRDSPWYPTLRLFRQPRAGDWDSVLAAVTDALSRLGR